MTELTTQEIETLISIMDFEIEEIEEFVNAMKKHHNDDCDYARSKLRHYKEINTKLNQMLNN